MAGKILNTRIQLKIDELSNWQSSTIGLKKGEIAIATVSATAGTQLAEPVIMMKVGEDGVKTFSQLPWAFHAKAADVYSWAKRSEGQFVDNFLAMVGADGTTMQTKLDNIFATDAALSEAIAALEKQITDLSVAAIEGRVKALEDYNDTHGNIVTYNAADFAPANIDTGVHAVSLASGTNNGTVKLTVDGVDTDNIAVTGLQNAAYATVESLNTTAKGYADAVEAKLPTSADYGVLSVTNDNNDDTITIGGTTQNPTIKVTENKFDAYGAAAQALQEAKNYADGKPHENTAHAHSAGSGTIVTDDGGIEGDVKVNLNVAFELVDKTIKLYDKDDVSKTAIATLDATEFIADGMLQKVEADEANNKLVFTWNTDAGVTETEIPFNKIADIYTGGANTEISVSVSNTNEITATLVNKGITEEKLEQDVQDALALARTALQSHQDISGKKDKQTAVAAQNLSGAAVIKSVAQNENGEITVTTRDLTPADIGATTAGEVKTQIEEYGYVQKSEAIGYNDILTKTDAAQTYETKEDATAKFNEVKGYVDAKALQADWNQNDTSAADYVKNRTHYVEGEQELIATIPLSGMHDKSQGWGQCDIPEGTSNKIVEDGQYQLVIDGIAYNLNVYNDLFFATDDNVVLADGTDLGRFYIDRREDWLETSDYYAVDDWTPYTVYLYSGAVTVHQLNEKFIPDTIARATVVNSISDRVYTLELDSATYATKAEVQALTTDDINGGTETWYFNCGTASEVV